jgi:hypothetical protein
VPLRSHTQVGTTPRPHGFNPAVLYNGVVTCQLKSGALENLMLATHTSLQVRQIAPCCELL